MNILILEDNEDDKLLLVDYLTNTSLEFDYSHAADKDTYLELIQNEKFDLILSDYNIPGYQAEEAFKEARKIDKHIPFIIVSGVIESETAIQLVTEFGINDFLLKGNLSRLYDSILREINSANTLRNLEIVQKELQHKNEELEKLSLVASHTQNGVMITDATGNIEWVNNSFARITGYTKDEVLGKNPGHILHGDKTDQKTVEKIRSALTTHKNISTEILNYHKNGTPFWTRLNIAPVFNDRQELTNYVAVQEDITAFKEAQDALKENEFRLQTAIEGADLGIWDSNLKEKTTIANHRWLQMLGYKPNEVDDLYGLFFDSLHPDDEIRLKNELDSIEKGKKEHFEIVLQVKNRSGDYFTILDKGKALEFDTHGKAIRMIGTVLDITEQVNLEQKLIESQFRLETAIEGASLGVWDANFKDEINYANDRWFEMLGFKPEEVEDSYAFFFSRVHPDDIDLITNEINTTEKGKKDNFEVTVRVKHKNGEYITILDKGTALEFDSDGHVVRMIGAHLDITEQVSTQNRLEKSLREKEMLIMEVHHRVKNNLAILAGLLELEIFSTGENPSLSKAINRIKSIGFVHELLYQSESLIEVNFKTYFESYLEHINKTFSFGEELTISADIADGDINVNEAVPLGLLVNELITNSIKYGVPNGGNIDLSLTYSEKKTKEHIFLYSDSGPGIDPKIVEEGTLGLDLIKAMLSNLGASYELSTNREFKLEAHFKPKERGSHGNPVNV